jgi:glycosyltransferase involved in cell wall biosynthesis
MRVKILEALAAGKAIVATPLAIEGLKLADGEQVSLARDEGEMADRIIQLLANPDQRTALAQRARLWACDHLGWSASMEAYEALWQELLTNG